MDVHCFSIGNKGYVAGGLADGSNVGLTEVWEYNSFNNEWTRKKDLLRERADGYAALYLFENSKCLGIAVLASCGINRVIDKLKGGLSRGNTLNP